MYLCSALKFNLCLLININWIRVEYLSVWYNDASINQSIVACKSVKTILMTVEDLVFSLQAFCLKFKPTSWFRII